ncbi:HAMP domain-containing histidine kinase, partial [Candidatus Kaiserbacteria bacterium]|nr:HAMP domain-containing histidine kinase [Candidatus Kaiserbacteria bacterium]
LWKGFRKADVQFRKQILLMGFGVEFFLFSFFSVIYLVSFFINSGVLTEADTTLEFYGLFGMTVFMVMMSVLIVRFKTFNVGANASIALVIGLLILTASQFTYVESRTGSTITAITLVLTGLIGIMLMRSVRKEIAQRKEIETLATDLAKANVRLKALDKQKSEFVSIASHQLRSPLTAIRGYASLLLDGSYGKFPKKASEPLERIEQSSRLMAIAIEDYLNVSRIELGNMKYDLSDFNLRDETEHVCDDLRQDALKRGLILLFRTDLKSRGVVHADLGKTVQIIQNLIHNSIKYTEKGTVKVLVRDDIVRKRIYIDIIDTGIGMSSETQQTIFQKFERAKNANSVNIHGTGLGLFVALKMAQAMQGNITATSEGEGKGSCFTIEFPLAM